MISESQRRRYKQAKLAYQAFIKLYPLGLDDLEGEEWRDIKGYEGGYKVSNFGRVKSFCKGKARIIKPMINSGYLYVVLFKNGVSKSFYIHKLVAITFISNLDGKSEINHIDAFKLNNYVDNLEWVTHAQNMGHAGEMGLIKSLQGEDHKKAVLTNADAAYIRENPDGLTGVELAKKFGVMPAIIYNIQIGRSYKTAGGNIREKRAHPPNRIPDEIRAEIRRLYVKGSSAFAVEALAKKFGLVKSTIYRIIREGDS